jgi:hypothetical protein
MDADLSAGGLVGRASVTDARRAVRFFWSVLMLATCASVAGNVTHAGWNASDAARVVAALAALVPPMVLLRATHSVGGAGAGAHERWLHVLGDNGDHDDAGAAVSSQKTKVPGVGPPGRAATADFRLLD